MIRPDVVKAAPARTPSQSSPAQSLHGSPPRLHGKQIEFTVPDYDEADCPYGSFKLLEQVGGGAWWAQVPNQHNKLWILDVNGTRLVIVAASSPDTSPQDLAALDEILASIQIG